MGTQVGAFMSGANLKLVPDTSGIVETAGSFVDYANVKQSNLPSATYGSLVGKFTQQAALSTTDATPTVIISIPVPVDYGIMASILVVGKKVDAADTTGVRILAAASNNGGTTAETAAENVVIFETNASTACVSAANDTTDTYEVTVTGIAAENWRWFCHVDYIQVQAT